VPSSVIIAFLIALGGGAIWLSELTVRRRVLKRMQCRPPRTPEEFGHDLFRPDLAQVAAKVREILARHLTVDLSRLSPEDTFVDLEMAELDSMASVGFILDLEREFGINIPDDDAARIKTFRDVVEYVSQAVKHDGPCDARI
jgi:acyl carrier protein